MKNLLLTILLTIPFVSFAQLDSIPEKLQTSGTINFLVNQNAFSNWATGGENNQSGLIKLDYNINYKVEKWSWDTKINGSYGSVKNGVSDYFKKTEDQFVFNTLVGKKSSETISYSALFNFKTQVTKGYTYSINNDLKEEQKTINEALSPAYLQAGLGMYWKKSNDLWVNISPISTKVTFADKKYTEGLENGKTFFGVEKGENKLVERGTSITTYYKFSKIKNVTIENQLNLFSNYKNIYTKIDVDYTFNTIFKINKFLNSNLSIQFIYDEDTSTEMQIKEVFGLGVYLSL